ncbi:unnamed protein product, partial [Ixodes pacificus]
KTKKKRLQVGGVAAAFQLPAARAVNKPSSWRATSGRTGVSRTQLRLCVTSRIHSRQQHDTSILSWGENRGTEFEDVVGSRVRDRIQAPYTISKSLLRGAPYLNQQVVLAGRRLVPVQ